MFKKFMKSTMALLLCAIMAANAGTGFVYAAENVGVESEINTYAFSDDGPNDIIKH